MNRFGENFFLYRNQLSKNNKTTIFLCIPHLDTQEQSIFLSEKMSTGSESEKKQCIFDISMQAILNRAKEPIKFVCFDTLRLELVVFILTHSSTKKYRSHHLAYG